MNSPGGLCRSTRGSTDDTIRVTSSGSSAFDFGFDIIPVGIKDADNIRSFGLFPNPATGHFVVSFEAKKPVKQVRVTLSNMLG